MSLFKRNIIKMLWLLLLLTYAMGYFLFIRQAGLTPLADLFFAFLFVVGLATWVFLTLRLGMFKRQLVNLIRRILAGDYDTGVSEARWLGDEVTGLGILINKMVSQLNIYDKLRVGKIGLYHRLVELISANVERGIILVDADRQVLLLNTAVQKLFGIEQEKMTFESIEKQENNKEFLPLFKDLVENGKVIDTCTVDLQLPIRNARKRVCLKMAPLKDQDEKVRLALIFVAEARDGDHP
ncbi:MAG: PAS domain-containing protein [Candidatus Margulisbacteria bacterium]|nr:PAS domain-containing protein [Candidatus Margulisiibacteriota bacterium]